jgi:hypothetical protein
MIETMIETTNHARVLASDTVGAKGTKVTTNDALARCEDVGIVSGCVDGVFTRGGRVARLMDHARVLAGQSEVTEPAMTLAIGAAAGTRFIVLVVFILLIVFFLFIKI